MGIHTYRPDARPAAAVGDAEGLVHVEMTHIGAAGARGREAALGLRVHESRRRNDPRVSRDAEVAH